eukprot:4402237-Amphidinium_carterae.1
MAMLHSRLSPRTGEESTMAAVVVVVVMVVRQEFDLSPNARGSMSGPCMSGLHVVLPDCLGHLSILGHIHA